MSIADDIEYEPPEHWSESITIKHIGVEHETDKAILFRKSKNKGFWLPKSLILKQTPSTVTFIDCIIVNEVKIQKRDLSNAKWREQEMKDLHERMRKLNKNVTDVERCHRDANDILCEALELLGEKKLVELWKNVEKQYA